MKKLVLFVGLVFVLMIIGSTRAFSQAVQPILWKMQTYQASPNPDPPVNAMKRFIALVNQRSNGSLVIHPYYDGELGIKPVDYLKAVRSGAIEIALTYDGYYSGEIPACGLSQFLWVGASHEKMKSLGNDVIAPAFDRALKARYNSFLLWFNHTGAANTFFKDKIDNYFDLKGKKVRVFSKATADYFGMLNASGVTIPFSDLYMSLQKGVVDGWYSTRTYMTPLKLYEVTNYYVNDEVIVGYYSWVVNQDAFNKLPANLQGIVKQAAADTVSEFDADNEAFYKTNTDLMEKSGMKRITLSDADLTKLRGMIVSKLHPKWKGALDAETRKLFEDTAKMLGF